MDRKKIKRPLNECITRIKKLFNPEQIILYGSFARNEATEWSDIDLLVLADFKKMTLEQRLKKIDQATSDIKSNRLFDIRALTIDEYNQKKPWTIYGEIKKEGIIIYNQSL
ncbi:MAG: nucleotidyltransferase domain-containing protein [bacterium]|nr:nucleotidyltransferase domain-containing protein [bacterium]